MRYAVDPDDGFREFVELWSASTADALHRVLVLHPAVRSSADSFEPFSLLQRIHEVEPGSSMATAVLLLTDRRWRNGVGQLVRRIAGSAILDVEQLDGLARAFLACDGAVFWPIPDDWFGDDAVEIELDVPLGDDGDDDVSRSDGRAVARRVVAPPLRRWATSHHVSRSPEAWGAVFIRCRQVDARGAAAIMAGLLDAVDALPPAAQELLIGKATRWPDQAVRRLGLGLLAERQGADAAYALARNDSNARIRAWAASLLTPPASASPTGDTTRRPQGRTDEEAESPTLF